MNIENEIFTQEEMELMATYEDLYQVPHEKQVTHWWGDLHLFRFVTGVKIEDANNMLDKSLKAISMTREEFGEFKFTYRRTLIDKMKDLMPPKYEAVIIFNKPMLFTNLRLDEENVPEGMHRYDIRDGGMDGNMRELKNYVAVNHWGTVLSRDALEPQTVNGKEMTSENGIVMTDDDYNYTGEEFTVDQFLENYDYLVSEYCEPEQTNGMTMG